MFDWIEGKFGLRTVASITSSLTRMVEDLKAHAEAMIAKRAFHHAESIVHVDIAEAAERERIKAEAVAEKISGLMN